MPVNANALALCAIVLLGLLVRLEHLGDPVRYDEAYTYLHYVSGSLWNAVHRYDIPNNHLLHSALAWLTVRIAGLSEISLRLPVFAAGVVLVPLTYLLGTRLGGSLSGLIAAGLVAGHTQLVGYSVDARGYGLQTALFVGALCVLSKGARSHWYELGASALLALAVFTVPTIVIGVAVAVAWGLWCALERGAARTAIRSLIRISVLTSVLAFALYTPALGFVWQEGFHSPGVREYGGWGEHVRQVAVYLGTGPRGFGTFVVLGMLMGVGADLRRRVVPAAAFLLLVPLAASLVHHSISSRAPFPRNFLFLAPVVAVLAAHGWAALIETLIGPRRVRGWAVALACAALALWPATHARAVRQLESVTRVDTRMAYQRVREHLRVGDQLAVASELLIPLNFYARESGGPRLRRSHHQWTMNLTQMVDGERSATLPFRAAGERLFLLQRSPREQGVLRDVLHERTPHALPIRFEPVWAASAAGGGRQALLRVSSQAEPSS